MTLQPVAALRVDAAGWVKDYLDATLAAAQDGAYEDAVVSRRGIPDRRSDHMVVVRRDGGATGPLFDVPRIAVITHALTVADANDLANVVGALMLGSPLTHGSVCVRAQHLSGPNDLDPDPSAEVYARTYSLFELTLRCGVLS